MPPASITPRHKAIQYLAMREHSYLELSRKLHQKGYDAIEIDQALSRLVDDDLLSDTRFGEAFVRSRILKGYGPVRICNELKEKGLSGFQVEQSFNANIIDWDEIIERAWLKKYSVSADNTPREKAKQWRFLQYRGFTQAQITALFRRINSLNSSVC
ncbi:MAG: recombination regulator RecX [Gammaproteobacteria bacterium]|nr:recombination regulator RecX [Gammaproteobacteria bacterium]